MRSVLERLTWWWPFLRLTELIDRRTENRMTELGMIAQAFDFRKTNEVAGDYFEFGLWRGKTFLHAWLMKRRYGARDLRLFGFDSFAGLPQHERTRDDVWRAGQFACSEPEFRAILRRHGVPEGDYILVKGFYSESLNAALDERLAGRQAAIAYIDCDLYESTRDVLRFLRRYLVNGSIVCFDDYYSNRGDPDQGEARALTEFLADNPRIRFLPYFDYAPVGKSFIVRFAPDVPDATDAPGEGQPG